MVWKTYIQENLLTYIGLVAIVGAGLACGYKIEMLAAYPTLVGAVLALTGVHKLGDVGYDYVANKMVKPTSEEPLPEKKV